MKLAFACPHCGETIVADDGQAGERIRCDDCMREATVPGKRRPSSSSTTRAATPPPLGRGHLVLDDAPSTSRARANSAASVDDDAPLNLPRAGMPLDVEPKGRVRGRKRLKETASELLWLFGVLAMLGVMGGIGFALVTGRGMGLFMPLAYIACAGLILYPVVRIIMIAFSEGVAQGLLCLLMPFYWLYYSVTRWTQTSGLFLLWMVGNLLLLIGWTFLPLMERWAESMERVESRSKNRPVATARQ